MNRRKPFRPQQVSDLIGSLQQLSQEGGSQEVDAQLAGLLGISGMFTSSIDHARRLIPNPCGSMSAATTFGAGGFADDRPHGGWAWVDFDTAMAGSSGFGPKYECKGAASPAIALCVACLKAMSSGQMFCLGADRGE